MHSLHSSSVQTSIVIVTFNNRTEIDTCLRSLQAHSEGAEIIVVDNLSTDGTLDYVRLHYPDVCTISTGRNGGFGAGVNYGARMAKGTFLAIVNPDIEVQAGWLSPLIAALEQQANVGLVTPTVLLMGSADRVNACGNDVHLTGLAVCKGLNDPAPPKNFPNRSVAAISGAAFVARRSLWESLGGFDERFFMYLEDTDLSLRVRRLGYTILHVPASRIWHRYALRVSATKLYHLEHNRWLMLCKSLSPSTLAILFPALALTELLVWAFCARKGTPYLHAKWCSYRQLWRERHTLKPYTTTTADSRRTDSALLRSFSIRLKMEQLDNSRGATLANHSLTVCYALCRALALSAMRCA